MRNFLVRPGVNPRNQTVWRVTAIAALSLNLPLASSAISPLLPTIRHDTGMSAAVCGLLITIPLFCFGALAPLAPRLARRFGADDVIAVALVLLIISILLRSTPGIFSLFGGTVLLGAAVTCGNVLLPGVIKRKFERRTGPVMGLYTTGVAAGAALGAGATVPLMHALGWSWRATLALWAIGAGLALIIWLAHEAGARGFETSLDMPVHRPATHVYRDRLAWQVALFLGFESIAYNAAAAWLPSVFVAHGLSQTYAGLLLAIVNLTGMVTTFLTPVLAMRRPSQGGLVIAAVALCATSLIGLLVAPVGGAVAWTVLLGLGQGAMFGLALSLILLRTTDEGHANELSGMAQTVGGLLGALGPVGLGVVHDLTGGWTWPLFLLLLVLLPLLVMGLGASRNRNVLDPPSVEVGMAT
jgi:CP family cyanate transporter-like MFS transporter